MTRSMTAFARAEHGAAVWELRSVNHRYLDISFRMPDSYRFLETELKGMFKDLVGRGKLECSLKLNATALPIALTINEPLVQELNQLLGRMQTLTGMDSRGDLLSLMRWPDVLTTRENTEEIAADVRTGFQTAVDMLVEMREREGRELEALIEGRLKDVEKTVTALKAEAPQMARQQQEKLLKRINDLDVSVDPARLEQELVITAQKLDVMEELDRLVTHVAEVRHALAEKEPVGRRLDFLMQELNREANTLSSKASTSNTTHHAVDLKVTIEQMREQIQNIE
ncbi:MAG: YicC family protein [Proteobacteria bacterium]|nr:YicC family protein [Pseudomonadota bacterium]